MVRVSNSCIPVASAVLPQTLVTRTTGPMDSVRSSSGWVSIGSTTSSFPTRYTYLLLASSSRALAWSASHCCSSSVGSSIATPSATRWVRYCASISSLTRSMAALKRVLSTRSGFCCSRSEGDEQRAESGLLHERCCFWWVDRAEQNETGAKAFDGVVVEARSTVAASPNIEEETIDLPNICLFLRVVSVCRRLDSCGGLRRPKSP
mmetsp:Transcript_121044/g.247284  ORF Transcript_121044/g.247284 Transcript_121044/m.247284 type:complete len:206 (-) Transcript_121044:16-633(-)